ncbi:MAG: hypothetical protein H0W81_08905 [Chloroflexi bacterium]|nr:hypothetical protein [Chloroflexota bacterium]
MRVVLLGRDLIIASRVFEAASRAGVEVRRVDDPAGLPTPDEVRLLLVDWGDRRADWGESLVRWCAGARGPAQPKVVLFGPHVDLAAHAAAQASGLGPMWARSKFLADLPTLIN